jgi:hypothetical protein
MLMIGYGPIIVTNRNSMGEAISDVYQEPIHKKLHNHDLNP